MRILLGILAVLLVVVMIIGDKREHVSDDNSKYEIWKYNNHIKEI